jgi:hypothetical protein
VGGCKVCVVVVALEGNEAEGSGLVGVVVVMMGRRGGVLVGVRGRRRTYFLLLLQ